MNEVGHRVSRAELVETLALNMADPRFLTAIPPLLAAGRQWNLADAAKPMHQTLFHLLEGDPLPHERPCSLVAPVLQQR
jgi:hypothetical protein